MFKRLRRWLPGGKDQLRRDTAEELRAHMDEIADDYIHRGMAPDAARRAAVLRFGNPAALSDSCQSQRKVFRMEEVTKDLRYGARMLRRTPGFTIIAALTLALGIGGTTAIFSIVNSVLLRPLPVPAPESVYIAWSTWKDQNGNASAGNFVDWREQSRTMQYMAATQSVSFILEDEQMPDRFIGSKATADFFPLLGVQPLLGRVFTPEEDQPGRDGVLVLTEGLWRSRFNADRNVLGRTLRLNGVVYQIIGVMPASLDVVGSNERFWVPMAFTPERKAMHDEHGYIVLARTKPGVTLAQAQSEMDAIAQTQRERFDKDNRGRGIRLQTLEDAILGDTRPTMYMLLGAVLLVLLIACVNVGTLQLARARARTKEIAIRSALGASSWRVARQLLTESFVLASLGGVLGLGLAYAMLSFLVSRAPASIPRISLAALDARALLFTFVIIVLSAALAGGWAAARARNTEPGAALGGGRSSGGASVRDRLRGAMVVAEIAMAIILLVGAGLLIRSAIAVNRVDLGFDPANLLVGRIALPESRYSGHERLSSVFRQIEDFARAIPGARSAALANRAPLSGGFSNGVVPEGKPEDLDHAVQSSTRFVTPAYFETAGIQLKRGRGFNATDVKGGLPVIIVNETFVRQAFGSEEALGKRVGCCSADNADKYRTVVGIVADTRNYGLTEEAPPEIYIPMEQIPADGWRWVAQSMEVLVRTSGAPEQHADDLRALMKRIDPLVPVYLVGPIEERIATTLEQRRFSTLLLSSFAGLALFLAAIGIYGVLSYTVSQRTQEIGIRMALGGKPSQVLGLILGYGLRLAVMGTVIGVLGALAVSGLLRSLLFGVTPNDLATYALAPVLFISMALLASYLPAMRATRIDPVVALRYE